MSGLAVLPIVGRHPSRYYCLYNKPCSLWLVCLLVQAVTQYLLLLAADIVKASSGPRYVVGCRNKVDKTKLSTGTRVALDMTTLTIMRALPREVTNSTLLHTQQLSLCHITCLHLYSCQPRSMSVVYP